MGAENGLDEFFEGWFNTLEKGLEKLELVQDHAINAWGALQKAMGKRLAFGREST